MSALLVISDIFLILGAFNFAVCAAGMLSFRDVYARISVLSTASGFGVTFLLIGAFCATQTGGMYSSVSLPSFCFWVHPLLARS